MPIPKVTELLMPVLRLTGNGVEHSVEDIRAQMRRQFNVTPAEAEVVSRRGINVFVNRVAWALAHLVMGKALVLKSKGRYEITDRGFDILQLHPSELTIRELMHHIYI